MNDEPLPIVCDATVVLNLGHRGNMATVVAKLREQRGLWVTPEVIREVTKHDPDFYRLFLEEHFTVVSEVEQVLSEISDPGVGLLGPGELSVLMTCMAKGWVAGIDELEGRKAARVLKIPLMGTIGILDQAVTAEWLDGEEALNTLRRLRTHGFHCPKVLANDDFADYIARLK